MAEIQLLGDLALGGALVMGKNETTFPQNPRIGTIIVKEQALYAYIRIGGLETWYPFANKTNSYVHVQGVASSTWTVNHNLGTTDVWIQVKDNQGNIIYVTKNTVDEDSFTLNFTTPVTGTVVVVAPDTIDVPEVKTQSINIANNAVIIDSSGVRVNGQYVLTSASIAADISAGVAAGIADLVDGAPANLDTLNELAAAINDDANYHITVTNALALKANQSTTYTKTEVDNALALKQNSLSFTGSNGVTTSVASGTVTVSLSQDLRTTATPSFTGASLNAIRVGVGGAGLIDTTAGNLTLASTGGTTTLADDVVISGNLTVNGNTTTVNSTITTVDDPIMTLGGDAAPSSDDGKDRGIEFRWHNGTSAKVGFFGFDDSTGKFTFIPDATNSAEVFSGTKGTIDANIDWADVTNKPDPVITLSGDASGSVTLTDVASGTLSLTLANSGVSAATYGSATQVAQVAVDAKGRITSASNVTVTPAWSNITSKPTTVSGFGITDAVTTGGNSLPLSYGDISSSTFTSNVANTTNQVMDTFSSSAYRSAKYVIQATSSNSYHTLEAIVVHDGSTNIFMTETEIYSGSSLFTLDADINSGNLRILVTPTNASTVFNIVRTLVKS